MSQPLFCLGRTGESALYARIEATVLAFGEVSVKHDRTQTAFVRKVQFAWVSMPRRKADAGALMLSVGMPSRIDSPRILHAAEVTPGRWMHHMLIPGCGGTRLAGGRMGAGGAGTEVSR